LHSAQMEARTVLALAVWQCMMARIGVLCNWEKYYNEQYK